MKCNICDAQLSEKAISFNPELDAFEPCLTCLEIAFDAAFCDGFQEDEEEPTTLSVGEESFDDIQVDKYDALQGIFSPSSDPILSDER